MWRLGRREFPDIMPVLVDILDGRRFCLEEEEGIFPLRLKIDGRAISCRQWQQ